MAKQGDLQTIALLIIIQAVGVYGLESDIIGITVSACVSFFLLCVVLTMIIVSFTWTNWYNSWMRGKGKVRMPREYFEKKEEARRRLLAESAGQSVRSAHSLGRSGGQTSQVNMGNGQQLQQQQQPPHTVIDRAVYVMPTPVLKYPSMAKTSWVQGWNQNSGPREHETLGATMVLEEEQDEEYRIETILVDNEVLDVGPYSKSQTDDKPVKGDVYSVPYIYSSGDKANGNGNTTATTTTTTETTTLTAADTREGTSEMVEVREGAAYATVGDAQQVQDMVVHL